MKTLAATALILPLVLLFTVSVMAADAGYNVEVGPRGFLIGGLGDTGDSFRYDGSGIDVGPGRAVVQVNEDRNIGFVEGTLESEWGTLRVVMKSFEETAPFMDGGIAANLYLHGETGNGPPVLPRVYTYLAGWGTADVYLDEKILYRDYEAHFMLTEGVRDEDDFMVDYRGPRNVKEYPGSVADSGRQVLHIVAHSEEEEKGNLPPYEVFLHAMWDGNVIWR
jgi:hypothetical protein